MAKYYKNSYTGSVSAIADDNFLTGNFTEITEKEYNNIKYKGKDLPAEKVETKPAVEVDTNVTDVTDNDSNDTNVKKPDEKANKKEWIKYALSLGIDKKEIKDLSLINLKTLIALQEKDK
jgi:hypothetical protein